MLIISRGCRNINKKYYSLLFIVILILSLIPSTFAEQRIEYNLTYDANGNLIQGFNEYYEYNGFNQLEKVRENNATGRILSEYTYDHEGNRLKKIKYNVDGTNETTYYWDKEFVQIINSSGTYNFTYYYHGDTLIAEEDQLGNKLFYHPDHLGSTTLITNGSGSVVEYVSYLPYGELLGSSDKRFLFTGKEKDPESNLYYYGARYYDPFFSHFTQADQNILNIYDPQDLNRYSYVRNNPYKYIDPNGDFAQIIVPILIVAAPIIAKATFGAIEGYLFGFGSSVYQQLGQTTEQGVSFKEFLKSINYQEANKVGLEGAKFGAVTGAVFGIVGELPIGRNKLSSSENSERKIDFFGTPNQKLVPSSTPAGREITPHAADRMANPPTGRGVMTPQEVDDVIKQGYISKVDNVRQTTTYSAPSLLGKPKVAISNDKGGRVVTTIKKAEVDDDHG